MYARLRPSLLDAQLLDLVPGALYMASTTVVVMTGALATHSTLMKSVKGDDDDVDRWMGTV